MKTYYTLAIWVDDGIEGGECGWSPEFGDYDRAVVEQEVKDSYAELHPRLVRIVKSGDKQAEIAHEIAQLSPAVIYVK